MGPADNDALSLPTLPLAGKKTMVPPPLPDVTDPSYAKTMRAIKRSASESHIQGGAWHGGLRRLEQSRASQTSHNANSLTASQKKALEGECIEALLAVPLLRDHVANNLRQPLPSRGSDLRIDWQKQSSVGALPKGPGHLVLPQTTIQAQTAICAEKELAVRSAKDPDRWRGFQRNFETEFNEQVVKQHHIMRK